MATDQNMWIFKSVSDEDRTYRSIAGYDDDITTRYDYDSNVANHKQVKEGDVAVIVDKEDILGFAKIARITAGKAMKHIRKCPRCGTTQFEARKNKVPLYRCNRKHEFGEDEVITVTQEVTTYRSIYHDSYVAPKEKTSINLLKSFYARGYNQNMSIQSLKPSFFEKYFPEVAKTLGSVVTDLRSTDAEDDDEPDHPSSYNPNSKDEREKIKREIKARRGQTKFRNDLRKRYGNICMITGCEILDIIEAAHINPYRGEKDNDPSNGLLLRSDIHTLYDLNLIGIDPVGLTVHVHPSIMRNGYEHFDGLTLIGCKKKKFPSKEALVVRWQSFHSTI